ncbi:MAG: 30S ribosomal protein S1 [Cytophagales bacterium]|jgi:small subunit ribosomal protein S1|nr:30S ribosomal protein S1 [Cytophagales bacterium]
MVVEKSSTNNSCGNAVLFKNSSLDYDVEERNRLMKEYCNFGFQPLKNYDIIEAKIIAIEDKNVIVDIGAKSNGVIARSEFNDIPELEINSVVDVFVENVDDKTGTMVLSRRKAKLLKAWKILEESLQSGTALDSFVVNRTKGGLIVKIGTIDAFLPGSQIDLKPVYDFDSYLGKHIDVVVLKINDFNNNVIVSHKVILERQIENMNMSFMDNLAVGQILEGVVKNLTSYGTFVDLGGIDGLLHLTDMSWGHISHPSDILEIGQKIKVVIIDLDKETKKLSLGIKQLSANPWDELDKNIQVGSVIRGKVVNITDYGVFVEIVPGVEGLIHISEISWTQQNVNINDFVKVNQGINVKVLELSAENHRMALGLKQLSDNPWMQKGVNEKFSIGSKHNVEVINIVSFGCYVKFENGIEGFLHISNMSWTHSVNHPSDMVSVGDKVDVAILDFNAELCNLSVGLKQLSPNPWNSFAEEFKVNSVHSGTVVMKTLKGYFVRVEHNLECFVPKMHLPKGLVVKIGDAMEIRVIDFSAVNCKLFGSHKDIHIDPKSQRNSNFNEGFMKRGNFITKTSARFGDIDELIDLSRKLKNKEENL